MPSRSLFSRSLSLAPLGAVLCAGALAAFSSAARADDHGASEGGSAQPVTATLTISGRGEVSREPDRVRMSLGVISEEKTASAALTDNNEKMGALIQELKDSGLEDTDIQTSNFSVSPRYSNYRASSGQEPKAPEIIGYRVSNQVNITTDIDESFGDLLDKVVSLGANSIGGINFFLKDTTEAMDEARIKAVADAKRRADLLAREIGVEIVRVLTISEGGVAARPPMLMARGAVAMEAASFADQVPISGGEQTYSATVSIVYEIR